MKTKLRPPSTVTQRTGVPEDDLICLVCWRRGRRQRCWVQPVCPFHVLRDGRRTCFALWRAPWHSRRVFPSVVSVADLGPSFIDAGWRDTSADGGGCATMSARILSPAATGPQGHRATGPQGLDGRPQYRSRNMAWNSRTIANTVPCPCRMSCGCGAVIGLPRRPRATSHLKRDYLPSLGREGATVPAAKQPVRVQQPASVSALV